MRVVHELPRSVREIEHTSIPMSDGCRLAARVWLPEAADREPVPALLEYIPYRKRDWTAERDSMMHPYLAAHGYACVRVDLRGSGDSEGVLCDEYLEQELVDGVEVIEWLARQPWCDGRVAMMGISWGGFNALQIAAKQPAALKTIITLCSTDDRYSDDVHYMGGCLLGDNLSWASTMLAYNSSPPDPELVGERWREMWFSRLEESGLWLANWLEHQHRDDYWKHGSVCEDFSRIRVPVMTVSGWADSYSNAVFRLLAYLDVPRIGIVGPWSHKYPHIGVPGPAIGFLQEVIRWLNHWMKAEDNGIEREPMLRAYIQDSAPPSTGYHSRDGRWVSEAVWPSPNVSELAFELARDELQAVGTQGGDRRPLRIQSPISVGLFSGKWCSESAPPDLPDDQREEDGGALVFVSAALIERLEILGGPIVELELSSDRPVAMIAARLGDVRPDGAVTRVTYGLLNLCQRDGAEHPKALQRGERYRVRFRLNHMGQAFAPGHKIRLSLSTSYWPHAWLTPEPVCLTIYPEGCRLLLPERRPGTADSIHFSEAEVSPPIDLKQIEPEEHSWRVIRDLGRNESVLEVIRDRGVRWFPGEWTAASRCVERYFAAHYRWNSWYGETDWHRAFSRGNWQARTRLFTRLSCDAHHFYVHAQLDAYESETRVFSRNWNVVVERDHV
jgi:putative CocE/NonD family hydrolase